MTEKSDTNGALVPPGGALADDRARAFCAAISDGVAPIKAAARVGVALSTIQTAARRYPALAQAIAAARENACLALESRIMTAHEDYGDPQRGRLASANAQWLLSKWKPETYGERIDINATHTINIRDAMAAASRRLAPPTIDQDPDPWD